jgi:proteasome assembly chaperone (PAC2) family protein
MDDLRISRLPELEHAMLIGAFAGWNDAASAASWAVKFLVNQWDATQFATVESDEFYDFTETRPRVRVASGNLRQFTWPATRFYVRRTGQEAAGSSDRDIVLLLGEEPQLRWKAFSRAVMDLCAQCHVDDVVLLGALVAEVPHTAPVEVAGVSNRTAMLRRMAEVGIERVNYEGPTGIVGALQEASRKAGHSSTSLWGTAPFYVSATPNLPVAEALLRKLNRIYDLELRLDELSRAARRFNQRVSSLVAEDADVSAYVRDLEHRLGAATAEKSDVGDSPDELGGSLSPANVDLPSAEDAIRDVEALLRRFREETGPDS